MRGPQTASEYADDLARLGSLSAVARYYQMPRTTLASRVESWRSAAAPDAAPGVQVDGDTVTIVANDSPLQPEQLLVEHGLDPAEWIVTAARPNSWQALAPDGEVVTLHQLKVEAQRAVPEALTIRLPSSWTPPKPKPRRRIARLPQLVVLFADPHFPLHEQHLYDGSLALLTEHADRITRIICLGDEGDWSPFKRHRANLRTDTTVNEAIAGTYEGLAGWRNAAPDAEMDLIPGNHTYWLQQRILEELGGKLAQIRRPLDGDVDLLSMRSILHLDHLRINYHDTTGEYHDCMIDLAPDLVLMHGTKTGKHGGATKEQEGWEGASIVQGHDHSLAVTAINRRRPGRGHSQRYAVSAGAMARRDLGYSPKQDVGQGFVVVALWPDGRWGIEMVQYDPQTRSTVWRDWRYQPS